MSQSVAVYLANPQPEDFRPDDRHYGEMIEDMLQPLMPGASFEHFDTANNVFPSDPTAFDAVVITGSSDFVTDDSPWIKELFRHIQSIDRAGVKLFAVCFGHQAVAVALGGVVAHRDIVLGTPAMEISEARDWMRPAASSLRLFSGNFQQVVSVPETLHVIGTHPDCPIAMTVKEDRILTVQFHPEVSASYMKTYVELIADHITPALAATALESFEGGSDALVFAQWVAAFLES